jgi:tetratricopeptide (TPR) repeat protein/predicted Ser/Thr protein kinase
MADASEAQSRLERLESLFHDALQLPADEREQTVRTWCADERELGDEVVELLESHQSVKEKIATAAPEGPDVLVRPHALKEPGTDEAHDPWIGRELGPYKLERLLGQGGMGVVYLGRRQSDSLSQTVAIKLVGRYMRSRPALEQFLQERDLLAELKHKNIARLLDANVTVEGLPYVVMEYVEGRTLDHVWDDAAVPFSQKLDVFDQLCGAVEYIHRHLLLHRDLKPANVLVTNECIVKLLDFGTAKLLSPTTVDSAMTRAGIRPLTLRYASPEQIAGEPLTTASDVYSLGVILYRLLAGFLPANFHAEHASPPAAERRKSDRTALPLSHSLQRDLDAIALKAIRTEPEARYARAEALAADTRAARSDRPVTARRDNWRYRTAKFCRRHAAVIVLSLIVGAISLGGLIAIAHQSFLEKQEQQRAERGLKQEERLAHMLLFGFFEQLKTIRGSTDTQRRTVSEALGYLDNITRSHATMDTDLQADAVEAYTEMGNLLGSPYEENLGNVDGAIRTLNKAVTLAQAASRQDPNLERSESLSTAEMSLARVYFGTGRPQDAIRYMLPAAKISERIAQDPRATFAQRAQAASVLDALGDVYALPGAINLGDTGKAIASYAKATAFDQAGLDQNPACERCRRGLALEYWKTGVLQEDSDPANAAAAYRKGLQYLAAFSTEQKRSSRISRLQTLLLNKLGFAELRLHHVGESIQDLKQAHDRFQDVVQRDPIDDRARFDLIALDLDLADAYDAAHAFRGELATDQEAVANVNVLLRHDPASPQWKMHRARTLLQLGDAQLRMGDSTQGAATYRQGLELVMALANAPDHSIEALDMAAENLLKHPDVLPGSAALALSLAQRAVKESPQPTTAQYATLAQARGAAGGSQAKPQKQ